MPTGVYSRKPTAKRIAVTCEICGQPREYIPSQLRAMKHGGRICSAKCRGEANRVHPKAKVCPICDATFEVVAGRGTHCSKACANEALRRRYAPPDGSTPRWRDPQKIKEYMRSYAKEHRAELTEKSRVRDLKYRETKNKNQRIRRARAKRETAMTERQWRVLLAVAENKCVACGAEDKLQADHIVPIALGGGGEWTNFQPLCGHCNRSKSDKTRVYWSADQLSVLSRKYGYDITIIGGKK